LREFIEGLKSYLESYQRKFCFRWGAIRW